MDETSPDNLSPNQAAEHNPAVGFHDIKPLPEFTPLPIGLLAILLTLLIALAASFFIYRRRQRSSDIAPLPPLRPEQVALSQLDRLSQQRAEHQVTIRELAAALSLVLRQYIERSFNFPAVEQTLFEFRQAFLPALKAKLPVLPQETHEGFDQQAHRILSFCQRGTFSSSAEDFYPLEGKTVTEALKNSRDLVRQLCFYLGKESERTQSVISASSAPPKGQEAG